MDAGWMLQLVSPKTAAGSFTWRRDQIALSPTVSWKTD